MGIVGRGNPDAKAVVNVTAIFGKVMAKGGQNIQLVDAEVKGSIHGSRRCAHRGSGMLEPEGITKLEEVMGHDDAEASQDGGSINKSRATRLGSRKKSFDDVQRMFSINVGIH
jgi:hypothetical protein